MVWFTKTGVRNGARAFWRGYVSLLIAALVVASLHMTLAATPGGHAGGPAIERALARAGDTGLSPVMPMQAAQCEQVLFCQMALPLPAPLRAITPQGEAVSWAQQGAAPLSTIIPPQRPPKPQRTA